MGLAGGLMGTVGNDVAFGHSLATPSGQVRYQDFFAQVQFRLVEDSPSARAASASVERSTDFDGEPRAGGGMARCRAWMGVERAVDDFGDQVCRRVEHVLVGGPGRLLLGCSVAAHGTVLIGRGGGDLNSVLDDEASRHAQHLADIAEVTSSSAEELYSVNTP